jgi:GNAT superfamily N-acetyltransferase
MTPEEIAAELTSIYRTPTGTMALRPVQGLCLLAASGGGLFTNASVGLGKSLICAIALAVIGGARPLILTEASNIRQMTDDLERFRLHWQIPTKYLLESYETLGPESGAHLLESYNPTCLILDESHKVKAVKESARARRVDRWRQAHPDVPLLALSGSPGDQFATYAHMLLWAVPALRADRGGPIPVSEDGRPEGREFKEFCKRLEEDEAFHTKTWDIIRATPGIVISAETYTDKPLHIKHTVMPMPPEMEPHWDRLRKDAEAPDGWKLDKGIGEQWGLARCFSNGMFYEHDPRPPQDYLDARKAWFGMCNALKDDEHAAGGPWDSPGQVAKAVLAGRLPSGPYRQWLAVRDTYKPVTTTTWLSRAALDWAKEWGERNARLAGKSTGGSIIWVSHTGVGEELARMTGWPYYGAGAKNQRGGHISQICRPTTGQIAPVIICSTKSCGTGKNLQYRYNRNLFMSPPSNNDACEQWFGRTHRSLQPCDAVYVELLFGCLEDWMACAKSENEAVRAEDDLTAPRKIALASHDRAGYPDSDAGPAWKRVDRVIVEIPEE